MRVLVADDEAGLVRVLSRCLHSWGYEPVGVADGLEAWKILKEENAPRIVILDWDMPGLSGIKVCRMLRESPSGDDTYVLLLTARQQKEDLIEGLEAGADDFISKPFDIRELQLRLAKGVTTRERRAAAAAMPVRPLSGPPPSGTALAGKFRLEKQIAEGGMANVWLGQHLSLGINVAVKIMKPQFTKTADYSSFDREARAAAQLRSPHTVRVYDHGMTKAGTPYLVMEYLSGESLWDRVDREGALAPAVVVELVTQIASALTEAHGHGIVHRDVKPENIVLVEDAGSPGGIVAKLVDFGLARPDWRESTDSTVAGTPAFMSPEHLQGEAAPSPALDLWALAATAFSAMTGTTAFEGKSLSDVVRAVCMLPPTKPSSVHARIPSGVDAWFLRACAHDPKQRYQTAAELALAFADAWEGHRASAPSPGLTKRLRSLAPTEPDAAGFAADEPQTLRDRDIVVRESTSPVKSRRGRSV